MAVTSISPLSTKTLHLLPHNALYQHVREHQHQLSAPPYTLAFSKMIFFAVTWACPSKFMWKDVFEAMYVRNKEYSVWRKWYGFPYLLWGYTSTCSMTGDAKGSQVLHCRMVFLIWPVTVSCMTGIYLSQRGWQPWDRLEQKKEVKRLLL